MGNNNVSVWEYQMNRYFNVIGRIGISQLHEAIGDIFITRVEYISILKNSWAMKKYQEQDFREWVSAGYITAVEFNDITGINY